MKSTVYTGFWLGLLGVAVSVAPMVGQAYGAEKHQKQQKQTKQIAIEGLQDIDNPDAAFNVELSVDRDNRTYKAGEPVVFSFKANKDSRLTLFNVATSGKVHILFPNEHHKDNLVKAGQTYQVPAKGAKFRFKAQGPAGQDIVKAIATLDQVALLPDGTAKPSGGVQEITTSSKDLAIEVVEALGPIDPKRWAEAELSLTVKE